MSTQHYDFTQIMPITRSQEIIKSGYDCCQNQAIWQIKNSTQLCCFFVKSGSDSLSLRLHQDKCRPSGFLPGNGCRCYHAACTITAFPLRLCPAYCWPRPGYGYFEHYKNKQGESLHLPYLGDPTPTQPRP